MQDHNDFVMNHLYASFLLQLDSSSHFKGKDLVKISKMACFELILFRILT